MGGSATAAGAKLGRYQIVKHLASGGMAEVLLARATGIEGFTRHVVIKRIRPGQAKDHAFVQMFLNEARLAAQLHHANIVQVHDIGQEGNEYFFAMEYVHGEDLRRLLTHVARNRAKVPVEHIVTIIGAAAVALHHAHEQRGADRRPLGIVHRDVTPANILVGYDGNVKVVDFGIAKAAAKTEETQAGTLKGKASYMSPEQCTGSKVDRRSDVFALGIVLYELTTTRRLFKADNDFLTMSAIVAGSVPSARAHRPDLPAALEAIIAKALALKPEDRYQSCDEMREALEQFAANAGLRTSTSGLAAYMKQQFGERPEPWLVEDDEPEVMVTIDFDGTASALVSPPDESVNDLAIPASVDVVNSSPIVKARTKAISSQPPPSKQVAAIPPKKPLPLAPGGVPPKQVAKIPVITTAASTEKPRTVRVDSAPVPTAARRKTKTVQIPTVAQTAATQPAASQPKTEGAAASRVSTTKLAQSSGVPERPADPSESAITFVNISEKDVDDAWDMSIGIATGSSTAIASVAQPKPAAEGTKPALQPVRAPASKDAKSVELGDDATSGEKAGDKAKRDGASKFITAANAVEASRSVDTALPEKLVVESSKPSGDAREATKTPPIPFTPMASAKAPSAAPGSAPSKVTSSETNATASGTIGAATPRKNEPAAATSTPTAAVKAPTAGAKVPAADAKAPTAGAKVPAADVKAPAADVKAPAADVKAPSLSELAAIKSDKIDKNDMSTTSKFDVASLSSSRTDVSGLDIPIVTPPPADRFDVVADSGVDENPWDRDRDSAPSLPPPPVTRKSIKLPGVAMLPGEDASDPVIEPPLPAQQGSIAARSGAPAMQQGLPKTPSAMPAGWTGADKSPWLLSLARSPKRLAIVAVPLLALIGVLAYLMAGRNPQPSTPEKTQVAPTPSQPAETAPAEPPGTDPATTDSENAAQPIEPAATPKPSTTSKPTPATTATAKPVAKPAATTTTAKPGTTTTAKPGTTTTAKPGTTTTAKPAATTTAKPAVTTTTKPGTTTTAKPTATTAKPGTTTTVKPGTTTTAKPTATTTAKPGAKSTTTTTAKPATKPTAKPTAKPPTKKPSWDPNQLFPKKK